MLRLDLPLRRPVDPDREAMMSRRPPLTPQEQRTLRHWSFAMAMLYGTVLLALLASAINGGPATSVADTAAAEKRQDANDAISSRHSPLTEASTQQ
jgi:hypothetical protein